MTDDDPYEPSDGAFWTYWIGLAVLVLVYVLGSLNCFGS